MGNAQQEVLLKQTEPRSAESPDTSGKHQSSRSLYEKYVVDGWLAELLAVLIGSVSNVGLCILIYTYDGNSAPRSNTIGGVDITLNTVVSILSTIGRASLLLAVSECISQLKWSWYLSKHMPLKDIDTFDQASRGAWGGLQLLWKINVRQIASLGALLVIAGLVVDPLSQQLVQYPVRSVPDPVGNASVPFAMSWTDSSQDEISFASTSDNKLPPLPMKGMIQNGLYSQNTVVQDVQPTCSSANCTWPSYRSLAVCARLADVTKYLKRGTVKVPGPYRNSRKETISRWYLSEHNYLLDNGYTVFNISTVAKPLQSLDDLTSDTITLDYSDSIAFKNISGPLADVFMIYTTSDRSDVNNPATFAATEFVLEWCVQNFTSSVTNGSSSTERHDSFSGSFADDPFAFWTARPDDGDKREYKIDPATHHILRNYFFILLNGTFELTYLGTPYSTNDAVQALYQPVSLHLRKVDGVDLVPGRGEGQVGLQGILDNIATGMTNLIRSKSNHITAATDPDSTVTTIQGTACKQETFVEIQWGWIAAPIILLVGSLLFVFATIMSSLRHRPGLWKSSSLPLLKALSAELHREDPNGMKNLSMMKNYAEGVPVRLSRDNDDDGWKLRRRWSGKTEGESHEI